MIIHFYHSTCATVLLSRCSNRRFVDNYNQEVADNVIIQYGGSVNAKNVDSLMKCVPDVNYPKARPPSVRTVHALTLISADRGGSALCRLATRPSHGSLTCNPCTPPHSHLHPHLPIRTSIHTGPFTPPCTPAHSHTPPSTPPHPQLHPHQPIHTSIHTSTSKPPSTPAHSHPHQHLPIRTSIHTCLFTPSSTCSYSHLPSTPPHPHLSIHTQQHPPRTCSFTPPSTPPHPHPHPHTSIHPATGALTSTAPSWAAQACRPRASPASSTSLPELLQLHRLSFKARQGKATRCE